MNENDLKWGRIAYDAYCGSRGWRSFGGEHLPQFDKQSPALQAAWAVSAKAVLDAFTNASNISPADPLETGR